MKLTRKNQTYLAILVGHLQQKSIFKKNEQGFSLIEIVVCILIIGLISSFGIPIYKKHINRAHVLEGLSLINPIKLSIQERALTSGLESIKNNSSLHLPAPESLAGNSVSKIEVLEGGKIQIFYTIPEGSLTFTPVESFGILRWQCQANTESLNEVLPPHCDIFKQQ
jgi:prepilin-type N-terminal cleavage/methylation domain-containing protein